MPIDTSIPGLNTGQIPQRFHIDKRADKLAAEIAEAGNPDDLLTTCEVAEWLGISPQWLEIGRHRGYGPRFIRLSPRRVRYSRRAVLEFLAERTHAATAEYARRPSAKVVGDVAKPKTRNRAGSYPTRGSQ
jgi:predicted DNA-binding transcriptional regulator AlpA